MTNEIPRDSWNMFFEDLTVRRFDWKTKVEVLNEEIGDQILEEGLPFAGISCEENVKEGITIEIFLGTDGHRNQTHNIKNPTSISYLGKDEFEGGVIEFEEKDGTKTLLHLLKPNPFEIKYDKQKEASAV